MTFIDKDGTEVKLQVAEGDNLLDIAQANDLEMEGVLSRATIPTSCFFLLTLLRARCLWWLVCVFNLPCNCGGPRHV